MATEPQRGALRPPRTRIEDSQSSRTTARSRWRRWRQLHLMSDDDGLFPLSSLNSWEREVVSAELARPSVRGWYRNPSRAAVDSLGVAYRDDSTGNWRSMHPDFVFFHEVDGKIVASIVDPHGHHLEDSLIKLQALAEFAEKYGAEFHRIEALAEVDGRMRVIDMKLEAVRQSILFDKKSAADIYRSDVAVNYNPETAR